MFMAMKLSIIVPVLNEAALIGGFLRHVRERAPDAELIVVDGGSNDGTAEVARPLADLTLFASRGRAMQMNAGARFASGDVLLFLHADSLLPENPAAAISTALSNPRLAGGCFRLRFPCTSPVYRISDSVGNLAVELFGIALGDHGIFCRRDAFEKVGGYPAVPLMEDAELYRALRRCGRMRQLAAFIISSPRRYEQLGPTRTTCYYLLILALYVCGARIGTLRAIYGRLLREHPSPTGRPLLKPRTSPA